MQYSYVTGLRNLSTSFHCVPSVSDKTIKDDTRSSGSDLTLSFISYSYATCLLFTLMDVDFELIIIIG